MTERKVLLDELAALNDGTCVDMDVVKDNNESPWNLVKDEIGDFLSRPHAARTVERSSFYSSVPSSALKKSIEVILRTRNLKEEIQKKRVQYDFDAKMNRIRKIKSKTYRRMRRREKLRKDEMLEQNLVDESLCESHTSDCKSEDIQEFNPVLSFNNKVHEESAESESSNSQHALVASAFQIPGYECNEKDFLQKKAEIVKADAPQIIESSLPGWDSWAGEGIEFKKNRLNTTIEKKEGIRSQDREDFGKAHVIINEHIKVPEKYMSTLPYGFSSADYKTRIGTPISLEANSLRVFNRFVKMARKNDNAAGEPISPKEYDPEY